MNKAEKHLNDLLKDAYSEEQAVDSFIYLTNKARGKATTESNIRKHHNNGELASLLKRLDPVAYQCLKNDHNI
jgi:hypothetical protein